MNILGRFVRNAVQIRPTLVGSISSSHLPANYTQYSTKPPPTGAPAGTTGKAKKPTSPKVTLVGTDQSVSIVSLEEAEKLSKRRDLKLVKMVDLELKTQRPVYKLMTSAEYLTEDLKRREEKKRNKQEATIKGDKLLSISGRISDHDLNSKIQNVIKWLKKSYEVRIVISADGEKAKQETIAARIEQSTKEVGNVAQKRVRDNSLRFQILPASVANSKSNAGNSDNSGNNPSSSGDNASEKDPKIKPVKSSQKQDMLDATQNTQSVRAFHTERMLA
ncbi:translation initiation factor IF-3 [Sabethes cyaneus]|uniref:translation initiation factor IF-3 n=1 Tax=Sabethes cyaneus TaxID=53552 RepID=UPI00237E043D|nr:translation initiation factor IF-3 [Sabethes cyaneus]